MGLKTTNYEVVGKGVVMPEAYAYIRKITVENNRGVAEFVIQSTRDNAQKLEPMETVKVSFAVNREENPYVTAYNLAKSKREIVRANRKTGETETKWVESVFYGWEDDIVESVESEVKS